MDKNNAKMFNSVAKGGIVTLLVFAIIELIIYVSTYKVGLRTYSIIPVFITLSTVKSLEVINAISLAVPIIVIVFAVIALITKSNVFRILVGIAGIIGFLFGTVGIAFLVGGVLALCGKVVNNINPKVNVKQEDAVLGMFDN